MTGPVSIAVFINTWCGESGVEELHWPAQSPNLNPNEHFLEH